MALVPVKRNERDERKLRESLKRWEKAGKGRGDGVLEPSRWERAAGDAAPVGALLRGAAGAGRVRERRSEGIEERSAMVGRAWK